MRLLDRFGFDEARLDEHDVNAPRRKLHAHHIAQGFDGVLRNRNRAAKRQRESPGDGADVDDAPLRCANEWQERLRDRELSRHVDVELRAELIDRQKLERPEKPDARIIHEPSEPGFTDDAFDGAHCLGDHLRVGDVEKERRQGWRRIRCERIRILLFSNARKHAKPSVGERQRRGAPNSRRRSRNNDCAPRFFHHQGVA